MTVYHGTNFTPARTAPGIRPVPGGGEGQRAGVDTLAAALERRHAAIGTPWRLLAPLSQAVLVIAFLRTNLTFAELAERFRTVQLNL